MPKLERHSNCFGFLRLLFALCVVISHVPEIVYGSRKEEPLTKIFGTLSLGDVAVDCFFLISGYLITGSFVASRSWKSYLKKRVARIYPGFLFAYAFCIFIVAPLGDGYAPNGPGEFGAVVFRAIFLQPPNVGNVFYNTYFPFLNTPMWTISIEFKCYIFLFILSMTGILDRRNILLFLTAVFLTFSLFLDFENRSLDQAAIDRPFPSIFNISEWNNALFGLKKGWFRLTGIFLIGSCFYSFNNVIVYRFIFLLSSAVMLVVLLFFNRTAHLGVSIFGAYLMFAFATMRTGKILRMINSRNDISYGVYLYSWPATKLVILFYPDLSLIRLSIFALSISSLLGWISWIVIEKPIISLVRSDDDDRLRPTAISIEPDDDASRAESG